jgi:phage portal protein BeeE
MTPSVVIGFEGMSPNAKDPAVKTFVESLTREHAGPDNAGKVLVTGGKVTFGRLDTSLKDLDFVALRKYLADFVRMAYRVPPEIVGNMASSNKATAYAAREIFAEQVVQPRMEFLRTEYQKRLMPLFGDDAILDYESPVPEDREFTLRVMGTQPSGFSYDEWRELAGKKPHPERQGFPAPMPGQKPEESQPVPDAQPGSAEDTAEEDAENAEAAKGVGDPPWAKGGV